MTLLLNDDRFEFLWVDPYLKVATNKNRLQHPLTTWM